VDGNTDDDDHDGLNGLRELVDHGEDEAEGFLGTSTRPTFNLLLICRSR
jgi:hypothetical protein